MIASFRAALLKLGRRPAVWVLSGIQLAVVLVLGYLLLYAVSQSPRPAGSTFDPASMRPLLYPELFASQSLNSIAGVGGAIAMILGVLVFGSEYGWGTLKTVFTQRPGRLATLAGTLAVLALLLALLVAAVFATAAGASAALGAAGGHAARWPAAGTVARAMGAGLLIAGLWASLGVVLSILLRQSALAIGIGLVYLLVVEGLVFSIFHNVESLRTLEKAFPGANANALVASFGQVAVRGQPRSAPLVGAEQAVIVQLVYIVLLLTAAAVLLRRRDVT